MTTRRRTATPLGMTAWLLLATFLAPQWARSQGVTEENVVYGMYSGLALLLDVARPVAGNGAGVVLVAGSGWHADTAFSAVPLKEMGPYLGPLRAALTAAGFTVFSINHRAAPRFHWPDAIVDVRRAVQFVRHNYERFNIQPNRVAGVGHSSGGHLVALLAVENDVGELVEGDPISAESWKLDAALTIAAPFDLTLLYTAAGMAFSTPSLVSFMGERPTLRDPDGNRLTDGDLPCALLGCEGLYVDASPIAHVSPDDPPFLIVQGAADSVVPWEHADAMMTALREAGTVVTLLTLPGGHAPELDSEALIEWLREQLGLQ